MMQKMSPDPYATIAQLKVLLGLWQLNVMIHDFEGTTI